MKSKIVKYILFVIPMYVTILYGGCTPRASTQGETLWNQLDRIKAISLADNIIYATDLPITLNNPGTYSLGEDMQFTGAGPAITIANSAITLDLQGYTLSQGATPATAIQSVGATIKNGSIEGFNVGIGGTTSLIEGITFVECGIAINQTANVRIQNCVSYDCGSFYTLIGGNSSVNNCSIHNCTGDAIRIDAGGGMFIVDCTIAGAGGSGIVYNDVTTASIVGCTISDVMMHGIQITGAGGDDIADCKITNVINGHGILCGGLKNLIQNCTIEHVLVGDGINNTVNNNTVYGCSISDVAGIGINDVSVDQDLLIFNTFLANIGGAAIVGGAFPTQQSRADVTADDTDFWQNVVV